MNLGFRGVCLSAGLVALTLSVSLAHADEPAKARTSVITRPEWAQLPTGDDMAHYYPERAQREGASGRAVLTCNITAQGLLSGCTAKDETPGDYGFDKAALALSTLFRMKAKTVDGKPVDGGTITIPIVFQVPEGGVTSRMAFGDGAFIPTKIDPAKPRPGPPAFVMPCPDGVGECLGHTVSWASRPDPQQTASILSRAGPLEEVTLAICKVNSQGRLFNCAFDGVMTLAATTAARDALLLLTVAPTTGDGVPTVDAVVEIPFVWEALAAGLQPKP